MEKTVSRMARTKADMTEALAAEKRQLTRAIAAQLGNRVREEEVHGVRGRIPGLPGTPYVNCDRNGKPNARVGRGVNGLAHYYWIPAVYRDGDERPWGYDGFEGRIPSLDMADAAYDFDAVAAFFIALIARDVREGA